MPVGLLTGEKAITVLFIEDHRTLRESVAEVLEIEGMKVLTAEDGVAGIAVARQYHPSLILCDIDLPRLDGFSVYTTLKNDPATADIEVLLVTAYPDIENIQRRINIPASHVVKKPFTIATLLKTINQNIH